MADSERWAALDVGSDTVHLLVADLIRGPGRRVTVRHVAQRSELLELGAAVAGRATFSRSTIRALRAAVKSFAAVARRRDARLIAAATEATREASNGAAVLAMLSGVAGTDFHLLSGVREAALGLLGARLSLAPSGRQLLINSGGASTEVTLTVGRRAIASVSLPVGAAKLAAHLPGDPVRPLPWAMEAVGIAEACTALPAGNPARAFATGGTAHGLAGLDGRMRGHPPNAVLSNDDLDRLTADLLRQPAARIGRMRGEDPRRVALIAPGALILAAILDHYRLTSVTVIAAGVRDGMLLAASARPDNWWQDETLQPIHRRLIASHGERPEGHIRWQRQQRDAVGLDSAFHVAEWIRWVLVGCRTGTSAVPAASPQ